MSEAKQMQQDLGVAQTVKLKYPVKLADGQVLKTVTVRRPKAGDLRAVIHISNEAEQGLLWWHA